MISLNISEIKVFMSKLLTNLTFDHFYMKEMELQTFTGFYLDGQFNKAFYSEAELEERGTALTTLWSDVKPIAFSIIKGTKPPLSLKIVFQLPRDKTEAFIAGIPGNYLMEEIGGLYLNVRFEKGVLHIVSGVAIKSFHMDKTLEKEWDQEVKNLLKGQGILYEED